MDILYIVMPAYNEESNIRDTVNAWYPIIGGGGIRGETSEKSRLVIADSGSTDATHTILLDLLKKFPQLELLSDTEKQHGPKVIALYEYAIKNNADFIFQTDSDGQTNPDEFARFWKLRNRYDGIFGYRNMRGDGKARAFVENVVCLLLKMYFGVDVPDANAPFRLMRVDTVKKYLSKMPSDYNLPNIMITTYFVYYREKVAFETITFKPRQGGVNSVNIPRIIKIGWKALSDFKKFKIGMKL